MAVTSRMLGLSCERIAFHTLSTHANVSGATIVARPELMKKMGVDVSSSPPVIQESQGVGDQSASGSFAVSTPGRVGLPSRRFVEAAELRQHEAKLGASHSVRGRPLLKPFDRGR